MHRVRVRERSSLANNNNVTCTVAEERSKQIGNAMGNRTKQAESKEPNQTFVADGSVERQWLPLETFGANSSILLGNKTNKVRDVALQMHTERQAWTQSKRDTSRHSFEPLKAGG
jgi:hypothetical protein